MNTIVTKQCKSVFLDGLQDWKKSQIAFRDLLQGKKGHERKIYEINVLLESIDIQIEKEIKRLQRAISG